MNRLLEYTVREPGRRYKGRRRGEIDGKVNLEDGIVYLLEKYPEIKEQVRKRIQA